MERVEQISCRMQFPLHKRSTPAIDSSLFNQKNLFFLCSQLWVLNSISGLIGFDDPWRAVFREVFARPLEARLSLFRHRSRRSKRTRAGLISTPTCCSCCCEDFGEIFGMRSWCVDIVCTWTVNWMGKGWGRFSGSWWFLPMNKLGNFFKLWYVFCYIQSSW